MDLPLASSSEAFEACLRKTRAPAMKPTRRAMRWVVMLFGNEFDADERAKVGGCDGFGEGERADLSAVGFLDRLGVSEGKAAKGHPIVDGYANDGDFISGYHVLMIAQRLRELINAQY
jgi:hypothetical protein